MPLTAGESTAAAARHAEEIRIRDVASMLISFTSLSFPSAFNNSTHPQRRNDNPVNRLCLLLSDGVFLADIVSILDPVSLHPSTILRSVPRNALSLPSNSKPVDARQKDVQYRANTRRVVTVVRKLLDDVRAKAVRNLVAPPNAIDAYLGYVASTSPERDMRPALRLAELVVAAAVYGPDGKKYAAKFWKLPSDTARRSFHRSMTAVAHAVYLPTPEGLYPDRDSSEGVVHLERRHSEEVSPEPIVDSRLVHDEGMGGRKISLVTEDEGGSRESRSPPRSYGPTGARYVEEMSGMEPEDGHSKTASEEFYTPREQSPSPDLRRLGSDDMSGGDGRGGTNVFSPRDLRGAVSGGRTFDKPIASEYVNETVMRSVTTSITKNISQVIESEHETREMHSTEMSSLDLAENIRDREAEDGEDDDSGSAYRSDSGRPLAFCDLSFMLSPSGSDIPAPSNQWQFSQQKASVAHVMSPQQLFSPPKMPKRLSRTATATQVTPPPGPPLFRADSPHLSVSSGGAPSISENEAYYLGKAQRVSFAPNIISPGGHQRPLGEPLRPPVKETSQQKKIPASNGARFSMLPPSAAGSAGSSRTSGAAVPVSIKDNNIQREVENGTKRSASGTSEGGVWDDSAGNLASSETYGGEEDEVDTNESISNEVPSIEEVEECEMGSSERDILKHGRAVQQSTLGISDTRRTSSNEQRGKEGSNVTTNAFAVKSSGQHARPGDLGIDNEIFPEGNIDDVDLDGLFDEKAAMEALNYRPGMSPVGSPAPSSPSAYPDRAYTSNNDVPPTPPSPPTVAALVESITQRDQSSNTPNARPVSTMEPSAGLFQKLISVWQNSEEDERGTVGGGYSSKRRGEVSANQILGREGARSHSTQESTIPSGNPEAELGKSLSHPESPRSRRRCGVRLGPGSPIPRDIRRVQSVSDDSGHGDERGSVASFSDAFSSDKERTWLYGGRTAAGFDWEEAIRGDQRAGIPVSSTQETSRSQRISETKADSNKATPPGHARPPLPPSPRTSSRRSKGHSASSGARSIASDGEHIKVDRRRLDWLTRELLAARDVISRQELQMTFAETQRMEQEEVLLLDKQNAESVVDAMKKILSDREAELKEARSRLSVAIQSVASNQDRVSRSSETSVGGEVVNLKELIKDGHTKLHTHLDESDRKRQKANDQMAKETRGLWAEVQRALNEKMAEMTEKRDAELQYLREELARRQKIVDDLHMSRAELRSRNDGMKSDMEALRLEKEKASHRYQLEMAHVGAQVELVNEFSKKLHDNFRETENLRQQVLQYQDKLAHITSTSGISQRQIKELREAVTRANDECARLRREADMAKRAGMEAVRRAEELEELRREGGSGSRFPDRQDRSQSGSFHSHEPVRPAGQNRPGGSGTAARYHHATRSRGVASGPTPAQKAWLVIKDKIGGIVTGKESHPARRRSPGQSGRRDPGRSPSAHSGTRSSGSRNRSPRSPHGERMIERSRSPSVKSRSSQASGSTMRSGPPRSLDSGRRGSPVLERQYMHDSPRARGEVSHLRAVDI